VTDKSGHTLERRITPKMADIPVLGYQAFWTDTCNKLKSKYQQLIGQFPDTNAQLKQLFKVICNIEEMTRYTPASVGEGEQWSSIVSTAEENRQNFCKVLNVKNLFSALYGMYTVTLNELKAVLKEGTPAGQSKAPKSAATQEDGRRKQHSTNKTAQTSKKAACTTVDTAPKEVATRNFFTLLRAPDIDKDSANIEASPREAAAPAKTGRPPPIVLKSAVNLILLQKQLKGVVRENF
jgi:hypothetical protein